MSNFPNYAKATNAAYQLLIRSGALSLFTDVFFIVRNLLESCVLLTYGQACFFYGFSWDDLLEVSEFGFSVIRKGKRIILYNETVSLGGIRFTIAHEIGHAALGHIDEHDATAEKEANCFARNLLCPIPFVYGLSVETVQDYTRIFNITECMAKVAFDKRENDRYYISDEHFAIVSDMLEACMMDFDSLDEYYHYIAS